MKTHTKTSSEHSINCIRHTILLLLTTSMTSLRILQQNMHHNKSHVYTNNTLTLVCCCRHTENHRNFRKHAITNIQKMLSLAYIHQKEFKYMINKRVWRKYKSKNMPPNRRLVNSKWVFKKKSDGRFRARLVAWGNNQIPGVDFTQNYSSVVTDVTLCVILIMWFINKWDTQTIDIETLFLYEVLQEEIYMNIPEVIS